MIKLPDRLEELGDCGNLRDPDECSMYARVEFPHLQNKDKIPTAGRMAARIAHRYNCHEQLVEALGEARLQIEYLHGKFQVTGTGNAVLAKLNAAIEAAEGE